MMRQIKVFGIVPWRVVAKGTRPEAVLDEGRRPRHSAIKKDELQNGVKLTIGCLSSNSLSISFFILFIFKMCSIVYFSGAMREWASRMMLNLVAGEVWERVNFAG